MDLAARLDLGVRAGLLRDLHAVLVIRNGAVLAEHYVPGVDENWGQPLGEVTFGPQTLHDLRSVSKSVTSLLYGIALDQGLVPGPDAPLLGAFPQYADLAEDPARAAWTVSHVLNMTLGTDWNEDLPYTDPTNSEIMMELAEDRYRFILDRPIIQPAGEAWTYNGGCSALLGYLISQGAGMTLPEFAQAQLFAPLGIAQYEWNAGRDGIASAASGLRLTAPDLARIGQMILAQGVWDGQHVVPAAWLADCMTPKTWASFGNQYSNQWYLSRQPLGQGGEVPMLSAMGNGGQRLFVIPELDLVVVTYSGAYNRMDQWMNPTLVLQRMILSET
ncbi:MAG: serine hydrolase [Pseudomonadota bacterium]